MYVVLRVVVSPQTKFNRLLNEMRKCDEGKFVLGSSEIQDTLTNKCGLYFGLNLQISGIYEKLKTTS